MKIFKMMALFVVLLQMQIFATDKYTVIELPKDFAPCGLNDRSEVVGAIGLEPRKNGIRQKTKAAYWSKDKGITIIDIDLDIYASEAQAINNNGYAAVVLHKDDNFDCREARVALLNTNTNEVKVGPTCSCARVFISDNESILFQSLNERHIHVWGIWDTNDNTVDFKAGQRSIQDFGVANSPSEDVFNKNNNRIHIKQDVYLILDGKYHLLLPQYGKFARYGSDAHHIGYIYKPLLNDNDDVVSITRVDEKSDGKITKWYKSGSITESDFISTIPGLEECTAPQTLLRFNNLGQVLVRGNNGKQFLLTPTCCCYSSNGQ